MLFAFPSDYVVFWLTGSFSLDSAFGKPQSHQSVLLIQGDQYQSLGSRATRYSQLLMLMRNLHRMIISLRLRFRWCQKVFGPSHLEEVDLFRQNLLAPLVWVFPIFFEEWFDSRPPKRHAKTQAISEATVLLPEVFEKVEGVMTVGAPRVFWVRGRMLLQLGAADMDLKRLWGFKIWWKTDLIWGGLWGGLKLRHTHICGWIAVRIYYKYFRWCCKKEVYIHAGRFWDVLYML